MATYSAGLLRVETLNAEGTSASLSATTVNTTTINTTNMNATNFGFTNIVDGGTLSVSGDTTLASVTASGTLGVTGASTLGHVVASGTLDVSGNTTLKSVSASGTLGVTGATTIGGNLSVSGSTVIGVLDVSGAFVTRGTATLANPSFTGVPLAPTATDGTNTTQVATTAFVNTAIGTFNNVVNYLADKYYCLYLIDVVNAMSAAPTPLMITIKFNKEQTFTVVSQSSRATSNQFTGLGTVYPYTILSTPTGSVGAKIQFYTTNSATGRWLRLISGNRQSTITFSLDYKKIVGFKEDLLTFPTLTTANTIVNAITTPTSQSDFLGKFLTQYTANIGNTYYVVDSSGNYTSDVSGTRVNMGATYAADTVNWKRNVACALMSTNSYIAMSEIGGTRLQFAQILYDGNTLVPYIQDPNTGVCGKLLAPEFFAPAIDKSDIYNIPISIYNASKRLNGISPGSFEPTTTVFLGRNCIQEEKVQASGSIPAYLKHIAIRGIDVIVYNHRLHLDPSQMNYLKGRMIMYARHKQSFLNDTYWYPDGPDFRINLNPILTVTKLICNDTEIPLHLVKRKNWDNYAKDGNSITFNIATAVAQTGVTFKYDADTSGGLYTEAGLNKIEIWYQGQHSELIGNVPVLSYAYAQVPSTKNVPISTLMQNPKLYDEAKLYATKYNCYLGPYENLDIVSNNGYIVRKSGQSEHSWMFAGIWCDSTIDFYPIDTIPAYLYHLGPFNDYYQDLYYHQIEFMVPKPFVASTGGTRITPIESADGNSVLYGFVPGAKVVGDDYRVTYCVDFAFRIRPMVPKVETVTLTDGSSIPYYVEVSPEIKPLYDTSGFYGNASTMQTMIRSCEKILGKYPFDTFGTVVNSTGGGGMEHWETTNITPTQIGGSYVIVHELVHMWWQNKVSQRSPKDSWIDEGFDMMCDYWIWDDISDDSSNKFYKSMAWLKQVDIENGWTAKSTREEYAVGGYSKIAFIHAAMYFNMGADFKVDASGNYKIKPVDASGNIAMDLFDSSNNFLSVALLSQINVEPLFLRPVIIDTSGTQVFMNSDYKLVDGSGNGISGKQLWFTDARMDLAGNVIDPFGGAIIAVGQTLTSGLKLPGAPLTQYYQPRASNQNFWNMFKYVLSVFSNTTYDYMSWRSAVGDYVDANKTNWGSKWPSNRYEAIELYDEMLNTGNFRELSATNYTYTLDSSLLPAGTVITELARSNATPVLNVGGTGYTNTFSTTGFKKLVNITYPVVHLEDSSGNALAGTSANFAGKDFTDKIVLIKRDTVENVQSQMFLANLCGAKGIISYNNTTGSYTPSLSTGLIQLPCVGVSNTIGASILAQIRSTPDVTATISGRLFLRETTYQRPLSANPT
jgi:hypothetical protein